MYTRQLLYTHEIYTHVSCDVRPSSAMIELKEAQGAQEADLKIIRNGLQNIQWMRISCII